MQNKNASLEMLSVVILGLQKKGGDGALRTPMTG
jgi:hypothetical protein